MKSIKLFIISLSLISFLNSSDSSKESKEKKETKKNSSQAKIKVKPKRRYDPSKEGYVPINLNRAKDIQKRSASSAPASKADVKTGSKKPGKKEKFIPEHANKIFLLNTTGSMRYISWLDKDGNIISKEQLPYQKEESEDDEDKYVEIKQAFAVPDEAVAMKSIYVQGDESNSVVLENNQLYSVNCVPLKTQCFHLEIKELGGYREEIIDKEKESKKTNVVFNNDSDKNITINWLSENGESISMNTVESNKKNIKLTSPKNAIMFTANYSKKESNPRIIKKNAIYEISCNPSNSFCNEIIIQEEAEKKETSKTTKDEKTKMESEPQKTETSSYAKTSGLFSSSPLTRSIRNISEIDTTSETSIPEILSDEYLSSSKPAEFTTERSSEEETSE